MWTPDTLVIVGVTFLLAGLVKGVIGLGVPTVSLAILTATLGLKPAMALLLFPSLITNIWQALVGGQLLAILRRLWSLLLAICIATWIGVRVLATADTSLLSALLGCLLVLYASYGLLRPKMPDLSRSEFWLSPVVGTVNGVLTGMTGSFVFPGVPYMQAIGLPRDMLIQAMGVLFTVSTAALALSLGEQKFLTMELGTLSIAGVVPALIGMVMGQKVRQRLSEEAFRKVFFSAIILLGVYITARSLL